MGAKVGPNVEQSKAYFEQKEPFSRFAKVRKGGGGHCR